MLLRVVNLRYNDDAAPPVLSSVTSTSKMFRNAIVFNGNIGNWDVSSITNMEFMFTSARSFDQDIGRWNVSQVRSMRAMFSGLFAFDGDISNWDVSQVTNMSGMLSGVTLSTENYDALLLGWSQLPSLQRNVTFSAGESKFCNIEAKEALANTPWDIFDRGREDNKFCDRPYVANEIPSTETNTGTDFSYTFPEETFNDMNTDTLTYTVSGLPAWLSFHPDTRTFSGTPMYTNIGTISITITATDELGVINMDNMATFRLTVPNRPPIVEGEGLVNQSAVLNTMFQRPRSYPIEGVFSDPDGGTLTSYSTDENLGWLSFNTLTLTFSGTPSNRSPLRIPSTTDLGTVRLLLR